MTEPTDKKELRHPPKDINDAMLTVLATLAGEEPPACPGCAFDFTKDYIVVLEQTIKDQAMQLTILRNQLVQIAKAQMAQQGAAPVKPSPPKDLN